MRDHPTTQIRCRKSYLIAACVREGRAPPDLQRPRAMFILSIRLMRIDATAGNPGGSPQCPDVLSPDSSPPRRSRSSRSHSAGGAAVAKTDKSAKSTEPVTLRLGYFPNVTHAPALVGVGGGIFKKKLGSNVDLQLKTFNSGTDELTAIQAGALDAAYIGPNPTISAWTQLDKGVKIVSGAASGGAYFVVKPDINSAADLKGKTVASPQLGNTQDVSLRTWLKSKGLQTDTQGGGDVKIVPQDNATSLTAFKSGDIAGRVGA